MLCGSFCTMFISSSTWQKEKADGKFRAPAIRTLGEVTRLLAKAGFAPHSLIRLFSWLGGHLSL